MLFYLFRIKRADLSLCLWIYFEGAQWSEEAERHVARCECEIDRENDTDNTTATHNTVSAVRGEVVFIFFFFLSSSPLLFLSHSISAD